MGYKFRRLTSVNTSYQNFLELVILCSNRWLKVEVTAWQKSEFPPRCPENRLCLEWVWSTTYFSDSNSPWASKLTTCRWSRLARTSGVGSQNRSGRGSSSCQSSTGSETRGKTYWRHFRWLALLDAAPYSSIKAHKKRQGEFQVSVLYQMVAMGYSSVHMGCRGCQGSVERWSAR